MSILVVTIYYNTNPGEVLCPAVLVKTLEGLWGVAQSQAHTKPPLGQSYFVFAEYFVQPCIPCLLALNS